MKQTQLQQRSAPKPKRKVPAKRKSALAAPKRKLQSKMKLPARKLNTNHSNNTHRVQTKKKQPPRGKPRPNVARTRANFLHRANATAADRNKAMIANVLSALEAAEHKNLAQQFLNIEVESAAIDTTASRIN